MTAHQFANHRVTGIAKIERELGYADVIESLWLFGRIGFCAPLRKSGCDRLKE